MFATASEQFGRALRNILAEIGEIRTSNLGRGSVWRYTRGNASTKTSTWPFVERPKDASTKIEKSSSSTKCSWQEKNWIWKFEAWKWETFATGAQATDWKSSKRGNFFTYIPFSTVKYLFIESKHHTVWSILTWALEWIEVNGWRESRSSTTIRSRRANIPNIFWSWFWLWRIGPFHIITRSILCCVRLVPCSRITPVSKDWTS